MSKPKPTIANELRAVAAVIRGLIDESWTPGVVGPILSSAIDHLRAEAAYRDMIHKTHDLERRLADLDAAKADEAVVVGTGCVFCDADVPRVLVDSEWSHPVLRREGEELIKSWLPCTRP